MRFCSKTIQVVDSILPKVLVWWSYRPPLLVVIFKLFLIWLNHSDCLEHFPCIHHCLNGSSIIITKCAVLNFHLSVWIELTNERQWCYLYILSVICVEFVIKQWYLWCYLRCWRWGLWLLTVVMYMCPLTDPLW